LERILSEQDNYNKIDHLSITIPDMDAALRFFSSIGVDQIGPVMKDSREGLTYRVFFNLGGTNIEMSQPVEGDNITSKFLSEKGGGFDHIAFSVDNLEEEKNRLINQGCRVVSASPTKPPRAYMLQSEALPQVLIQISQIQTRREE
jgi:methylmalonyl-CoA/ethylmalonyl-CoA epimerase